MARRYDQAVKESLAVVERLPDFGYARSVLGLSYALTGRSAEAMAEAQRAAQIDDGPLLLVYLAQVQAFPETSRRQRKCWSTWSS